MPKEKSVGAVVFRLHNRLPEFLLLHYSAGYWGFAKGHVEKNETEEQTLRREVEEETTLTGIEILPGFKKTASYFFKRGNETIFKEVVFYLAKAGGNVKISHEHTAFEWLPFPKAIQKLSFENNRKVLLEAKEFIEKQKETK